jgi:hypothetical protein
MLKWMSKLLGGGRRPKAAATRAKGNSSAELERLQPLVATGTLAEPGQKVAELSPDVPVESGQACAGRDIVFDEESRCFSASAMGLVSIGAKVQLVPLLVVSDDKMQVHATLTVDDKPAQITLEDVRKALSNLRVTDIDLALIRRGLAPASDTPGLVACGVAPQAGSPGWVEWHIDINLGTGQTRDNGTIDFKDRQLESTVVEADDPLARIHPPMEGTNGQTVLGEVLSAPELPEGDTLEAGDGVTQNGLELVASQAGRAKCARGELSVMPTIEIKGDVDYATGHVNAHALGVCVRGGVQPGFLVTAGGPIEIGGAVDDGIVRGGDDVFIRSGIIGRETGQVSCRGALVVRYCQGATLHAVGDITIPGGITQSTVRTTGMLVAVGTRGCIVGGTAIANAGIIASRAGSALGGSTRLTVGTSQDERDILQAIIAPRQARLDAIRVALGERIEEWTPDSVPDPHRDDFEEFLQLRDGVAFLQERLNRPPPDGKLERAQVHIEGECHPGVIITIAGQSLRITTRSNRISIGIDPASGEIAVVPLRTMGSDVPAAPTTNSN